MKLHISILLILVFIGCGYGQSSNRANIYRDKTYPFSVSYPISWNETRKSQPNTVFKIQADHPSGLPDFNINVSYEKANINRPSSALADFLANSPAYVSKVNSSLPNARVLASGKTLLSNKEAYFIKSTVTLRSLDKETPLALYQIIMMFEGYTYTLTFRSQQKDFNKQLPIFKVIASGFTVRSTNLPTFKKNNPNGLIDFRRFFI